MEQIGGNNAVFRLACLLFLEFFLVLLFFDYSLLLDISQFEPFAREIFYKTVMFNFTDNEIKSFRFRFDLGRWVISQSFESVRNYEAYCIVRFFFSYIRRCMHLQSFAIGVCSPQGEEKRLWLIVAFSFWWKLMIAINWLLDGEAMI